MEKENKEIRQTARMPEFEDEERRTARMPEFENEERRTARMPEFETKQTVNVPEFSDEDDGVVQNRTLLGEHGRYVTKSRLNSGGTAEIWLVSDGDNDYVAKIYNSNYHNHHIDEFYNKFKEEFQKGNTYKGLISIKDRGFLVKRQFYILPYYSERDFGAVDLSDEELLGFVQQINETLHTLHSSGFYHRDIKPDNILYNRVEKRPVLIDYGSITVGGNDYGYEKSITKNVFRTEGYTAPEVSTEYGLSGGKRVMANEKTDYFSLGAVLAGVFKKRKLRMGNLVGELSERDYRLFSNDIEAFHATQENKVAYPALLEKNPRFLNLVQALLRYDNATRAGYKEVCRWLQGEDLEIDDTVHKKIKFEYVFHGEVYDSKAGLARAMALDWDYAITEVFRQSLYQNFPKDIEYKADRDFILDTVESYEKNYGEVENLESACVLEIISHLDPSLPFSWKGVIYENEDGKTNYVKLAGAFYDDVENGTKYFDALIKTPAIRVLLPSVSEEDCKLLIQMGNKSEDILKYKLAETCDRGSVINKVSKGVTKSYPEYMNIVFGKLGAGAFDEAFVLSRSETPSNGNILLELLQMYTDSDLLRFIVSHYAGIELPVPIDGQARYEQMIVMIKNLAIKELYEKEISDIVNKSKIWRTVTGIMQRVERFDFIDYGDNAAPIAAEIGSALRSYRNEEQGVTGIQEKINLIGKMIKTMGRFFEFYIYDEKLAYSGLLLKPNKKNYSFIRSKKHEDNLWMLGSENMLSPAFYGLETMKNGNVKSQLIVQDAAISDSVGRISTFYENMKIALGEREFRNLNRMKGGSIVFGGILSVLTMVFGIGIILSFLYLLQSINLPQVSNSCRDFRIMVGAIELIVGVMAVLVGFKQFREVRRNKNRYIENKHLLNHYQYIKKANEELSHLAQTKQLRALSESTKELIPYTVLSDSVKKYYLDKNLNVYSVYRSQIKYVRLILLIIPAFIGLTFNILPAGAVATALVNRTPSTVLEKINDYSAKKNVLAGLNRLYSNIVLSAIGEETNDFLIKGYNNHSLSMEQYTNEAQALQMIYRIVENKAGANGEGAPDKLVASKQAYAEGMRYMSEGDKEKGARYLLSVVAEDSNYGSAQATLNSYLDKYYKKQRESISKKDGKELKKILNVYKKILPDGGGDNSDLRKIYNTLSKDLSENAIKKLVAYFVMKNVESWRESEAKVLRFAKIKRGIYAVDVGSRNSGLEGIFNKYSYKTYVFSTTGEINQKISDEEELKYSKTINLKDISEGAIVELLS